MRSELRLVRGETALIVIDVQERLFPAMEPELGARLQQNLLRLGEATKLLGIPVVITEQYPKGLGPTLAPVRTAFAHAADPIEKLCFDACGDAAARAALERTRANHFVIAGMEAHICVYQTVRSLTERGLPVHVLTDAVASRTRENYEIGLELVKRAGAIPTSTETVLFDLLGGAGTDEFKAISRLVR